MPDRPRLPLLRPADRDQRGFEPLDALAALILLAACLFAVLKA